jgi:hypothetical protein
MVRQTEFFDISIACATFSVAPLSVMRRQYRLSVETPLLLAVSSFSIEHP